MKSYSACGSLMTKIFACNVWLGYQFAASIANHANVAWQSMTSRFHLSHNYTILSRVSHCPWINNCVGANNQRHFVLYIACLAIGIGSFISLVLYRAYCPTLFSESKSAKVAQTLKTFLRQPRQIVTSLAMQFVKLYREIHLP